MRELYKNPKNHSQYIDGLSRTSYSYEFKQIRKLIHKRDKCKCQLCSKTQKQENKDLNRELCVHHIDYNKENIKKRNLISLCLRCHIKTNSNRDFWFAYFTYKIKEYIYEKER